MDSLIITIVTAFALVVTVLTLLGQNRGWGVAPLGILGLGFIVPLAMLLSGVL